MNRDELRVLERIRTAFSGVALGQGIGLLEAQGHDEYAGANTLKSYRAKDEKYDWSMIEVAKLDKCSSSLSFFDPAGMRFHLPAYLVADLLRRTKSADILFHLTHFMYGMEDRFGFLTKVQRESVREFLKLRLSDRHYAFYHERIVAALDKYWTA